MSVFKSKSAINLYRAFKALDPASSQSIIRFYQDRKNDIEGLEFDEYLELSISYLDALYAAGEYAIFLDKVQPFLELVIRENVRYYEGVDIFHFLLSKKALAHYHLLELSEACAVLQQLIRMDPTNNAYKRNYFKCRYRNTPRWLHNCRAVCIAIFLLTSFIIFGEILFVPSHWADKLSMIQNFRLVVFFSGLLLLIMTDLWFRASIQKEIVNLSKNRA